MNPDAFANLAEASFLLRFAGSPARALALVKSANRGCGWWMRGQCQNGDLHVHITGGIKPDSSLLATLAGHSGPITLHLDSTGGCGLTAFEMVRHLESRRGTTAIVEGNCKSAAVDLLLACGRRCARADAGLMIHGSEAYVHGKSARLRQAADSLDASEEEHVEFIARRTGQSISAVLEWMTGPDKTFTPNEALGAGLIHFIIEPRDQTMGSDSTLAPADTGDDRLAIELIHALRQLDIRDRPFIAGLLKPLLPLVLLSPAASAAAAAGP